MKTVCLITTGLFASLCLLTLSAPALGDDIAASETDSHKILTATFNRDDGNRMAEHLRMTIADARGRERVRVLRRRMMKFNGGDKTLILFEAPGDLRNTGLLSINYRASAKPPDQWLYLPGLGRSTRISSKRRSGSFVGSDLSYADLTPPNPDNYTSELVSSDDTVEGKPVWRVKLTPKTNNEKEQTGYSQLEFWVCKESLLPLRVKAWMRNKRLKYITMSGVRRVDGVWTPKKIVARTVRDGKLQSQTRIDQLQVAYNQDNVRESDFTTHRLEQGL